MPSQTSKITSNIGSILRYTGLVLLLIILISIDWPKAYRILIQAEPIWLAVAALLNFIFIVCKSLRWHSLLVAQNINYGIGRALKVYQAGSFFSVVTPGRIGDVIKISFLKRDLGVLNRYGLVSVVLDRLFDLACLLAAAIGTLLVKNAPEEVTWSVAICSILVFGGGVLFFNPKFMNIVFSLCDKLPGWLSSKLHFIQDMYKSLLEVAKTGLLLPLLFSLCAYAALFVGSAYLGKSIGIPLSIIDSIYCISIANVVSLLPLSVSGVGTREFAMIILFRTLGFSSEHALLFSFGYFIVSFVFSNGLGAYFWFSDPISTKQEQS